MRTDKCSAVGAGDAVAFLSKIFLDKIGKIWAKVIRFVQI